MNSYVITLLQGSTPIAAWGAVLSTLLAVIKIWEVWRARIRIEVGHNFTSNEHIGNQVIIRNLGATPLIITYWELVWCERKLLRWQQSLSIDPEENVEDIKLAEHSSIKLSFTEMQHFKTSPAALKGRTIYLRLYLASRSRPIKRKVYD